MKKLVLSLQKLDPKTVQRLERYLHDPDTGPHPATVQLFTYLQTHHPNFQAASFQDYSKHYGQGRLDMSEFRLRCSYLLKKVHDFMAREEMENDPSLMQRALITSLIKQEDYREADRHLRYAMQHLTHKASLESDSYHHGVRLQEVFLDLSFSQDVEKSHVAVGQYFDMLDHMYIGLQLKYLLPLFIQAHQLGIPFPEARWEFCRQKMEVWGEQAPPLARMAYQLLLLLLGGSRQHYQVINELLETYAHRMSAPERINIYGHLQNFLTKQQSKGDSSALQELFLLYQRMDREGLIFGKGDFTEYTVRNVVITACRLGETEWARNFLTQNKTQIIESAGENVFAYVSAFQNFYAGEYSQALRLLQEVKVTAPQYRTGHQTLLLRIYFELHDSDSIEAVAETFRRYLNRSTDLSERQKDLNRNFISVVQLLARSRDGGLRAYRKKRIAEYLKGDLGITDRTWLDAKFKGILEKG